MLKIENLRLEYGYKAEWLKRTEDHADKVNRGFLNSQVVASLWIGERLIAIGKTPYLDWNRAPELTQEVQ
jgi:hypothetical protein